MGVPLVYRKSGEITIATYDFYDLSTKTGYKKFYGVNLINGSTTSYALITNQIYGDGSANTQSGDAALDLDFDVTFNNPTTIRGGFHVCVPVSIYSSLGAAVTTDVAIKLYKVVGATETQIGATATKTIAGTPGAGEYVVYNFSAVMDAPITTFGLGDKFRLNITTTSPGGSKSIGIYHDPMARTGSYTSGTTSQLTAVVPFRVDL